ncbi:MAG: hypothetical protein KME08_11665 [Aphanothece sp. CMT-3BRIN-NPC111]|nr:hypothetical protein [Aphanothece sp. CMT-3BRIN-NPC111]
MIESSFVVPSDITFKDAIALTESLIKQMEAGELPEAEIKAAIATLVKTENGARGFFVTYLTSDSSLADDPSEAVVQALQSSPEIVAELLAKNLAMSAAMTLTHSRQDNEEMAQSSERVRDRTTHLIKKVDLASVYDRCRKLLESAATGEGNYKAFLERWGYDTQQRQLMCQALKSVIAQEK